MSADTLLSCIDYPLARPLIVILGPTAVGKTEIAIQVAESLSAEIISADLRLPVVYRDGHWYGKTYTCRAFSH